MTEHDEIRQKLARRELITMPRADLDALVPSFEVVRSEDTLLAGLIRILKVDDAFAVAEFTAESNDGFLRAFDSRTAADAFVNDRLDTYERMWDGCGCRIDYTKDPASPPIPELISAPGLLTTPERQSTRKR